MCLVIDICCFATVFDSRNQQHRLFSPVLKWVTTGKGRVIYGGTKYNDELKKSPKFLRILVELQRSGRALKMPVDEVDTIAEKVKAYVDDRELNDEHLIALVIVSRCRVVCTFDKPAIRYLKRSEIFSKHKLKRPRIYSSQKNKTLCSDRNVVGCCLDT